MELKPINPSGNVPAVGPQKDTLTSPVVAKVAFSELKRGKVCNPMKQYETGTRKTGTSLLDANDASLQSSPASDIRQTTMAPGQPTSTKYTSAKTTFRKPKVWCFVPGCDQEFQRRGNLIRHLRSQKHQDVKRWICLQCDLPFTSPDDLSEHLKQRHRLRIERTAHWDQMFAGKPENSIVSYKRIERRHPGKTSPARDENALAQTTAGTAQKNAEAFRSLAEDTATTHDQDKAKDARMKAGRSQVDKGDDVCWDSILRKARNEANAPVVENESQHDEVVESEASMSDDSITVANHSDDEQSTDASLNRTSFTPLSSVASDDLEPSEPESDISDLSAESPKQKLIRHVIVHARMWLHLRLREFSQMKPALVRHGTHDGGGSSSKDGSAMTIPQSSNAGAHGKKRRTDERDEDEDSSGAGNNKRPRGPGSGPDSEDARPLFACHFCKRRPHLFVDPKWKHCWGHWPEVHRVKQHLLTWHKLKPRCPRCGEEFETQTHVDAHLQRPDICTQRELPRAEGITIDMEMKLKSKVGISKMTPEEKWLHWYKILFPDDPPDAYPTPYYEACMTRLDPRLDYIYYDYIANSRRELELSLPEAIAQNPEVRDIVNSVFKRLRNRIRSWEGWSSSAFDASFHGILRNDSWCPSFEITQDGSWGLFEGQDLDF